MARSAGVCSPAVGIRLAALFLALAPLASAASVPHPDRPDRLVETRDGMSVEYSPGQEAWVENAFDKLRQMAAQESTSPPAPTPPSAPAKAVPGSARDLRERRDVFLAAIARHVGLEKPTELQGKAFNTFLGHYEAFDELIRSTQQLLPALLTVRHMAIWQRDDLVGRLRQGVKIQGMIYDPATDSGSFEIKPGETATPPEVNERMKAIYADIQAQKLNYRLNFDKDGYSATVKLSPPPEVKPKEPDAHAASSAAAPQASEIVFPVIYRGDLSTPPADEAFIFLPHQLQALRTSVAEQAARYRDANMVGIILHETAEIGLIDRVIRSRDRRWLCDGTANYVAWRIARDLIAPDFAAQVYNMDSQLRQHAVSQPRIDLVRWSAVENQKEADADTPLTRAHYAFATRAMFLLAAKHGESALAQLWADVAKTPLKKVSARTFADAYRKRFKGDLSALIKEAQKQPIAPAPAPAAPTPAPAKANN